MSDAKRDANRTTTLLGVSTDDGTTPLPVEIDPDTGEVLVKTSINVGDIEIGAVEIKNSTDDTRAVVGANGLEVVPHEVTPTDSTKVNASLAISNTDEVEDSTKVLTKTIGATSWTKTLSLNAGGDVIAVSAWVEV